MVDDVTVSGMFLSALVQVCFFSLPSTDELIGAHVFSPNPRLNYSSNFLQSGIGSAQNSLFNNRSLELLDHKSGCGAVCNIAVVIRSFLYLDG